MPNLNFSPFPDLSTERLVLRQLTQDDAHKIFMLRSNEEVNKFLDRPKAITLDEASQFIQKINDGIAKGEWVYWAVNLKNDAQLTGTICYWNIEEEKQRAEIGYELHPAFQGKGIMQEAIEEVIAFGFEKMRLEMITAFTHYDNQASIKLLEKNNFGRDEKLEQEMIDELGNHLIYSLKSLHLFKKV